MSQSPSSTSSHTDDINSPSHNLASSLVSSAAAAKSGPTTCERVIGEILSTEKLYVNSLQSLQQLYLQPLQTPSLQSDLGVKPQQIQTIFSNLNAIIGFHVILLEELSTKVAKSPNPNEQVNQIAAVFLKMSDFMKMYTSYVNGYQNSLTCLTELGENKKWLKWLNETRSKSKDAMDLMSLLIMPVQRIPRYELLLKELSRQTSGPHAQLDAALAKIVEINSHVNETKRLVDRVADLLSIQVRLAGSLPLDQDRVFKSGSMYAPWRRLVRQGELKKRGTGLLTSDKSRMHYLCNDLLMWTNSHGKYKHHVSLLHAELSNPPENDFIDVTLGFELQCNLLTQDGTGPATKLHPIDKLTLFCTSQAEKDAWVRDLDACIQEATILSNSSNGFSSVVPDRLRRLSEMPKAIPGAAHLAVSNEPVPPASPMSGNGAAGGATVAVSSSAPATTAPLATAAPSANNPFTLKKPAPAPVSNGHAKKPSTSSVATPSPRSGKTPGHGKTLSVGGGAGSHSRNPSGANHSRQSSTHAVGAGSHSKHPSTTSVTSTTSAGRASPGPSQISGPVAAVVPVAHAPPVDIHTPSPPLAASGNAAASSSNVGPSSSTSSLKSPSALIIDDGTDDVADELAAGAENPLITAWRNASEKMYRMQRNDITSLKMLKTPTPNVKAAMESVGALLDAHTSSQGGSTTPRGLAAASRPSSASSTGAGAKKFTHTQDDWSALQGLLVKPNFLTILREFNSRSPPLSEKADKKLTTLSNDPTMTSEAVTKASTAAGVLWDWVLAYWRLKKSGVNAGITIIDATPAATPTPSSARPQSAAPVSAKNSTGPASALKSPVKPSAIPRPSSAMPKSPAAPTAASASAAPSKLPPRPKTPTRTQSISSMPTAARPKTPTRTLSISSIPTASSSSAAPASKVVGKIKLPTSRPVSAVVVKPAVASDGDAPPPEEMVKLKTQYRDTFVNHFHPGTSSYWQCSVVDTHWERIGEPKLAKLKVAESAAAARIAASPRPTSAAAKPTASASSNPPNTARQPSTSSSLVAASSSSGSSTARLPATKQTITVQPAKARLPVAKPSASAEKPTAAAGAKTKLATALPQK